MRTLPDARDIAMALEYGAGATLEEVGRRHRVTRERVRQRLAATGVKTRTKAHRPAPRNPILPRLHRFAAEICSTVLHDWSPCRVCALMRVDSRRVVRLMPKRPNRHVIADAKAPMTSSALALWNAGVPVAEIAEVLETTKGSIGSALHHRRAAGQEVRVADRREAGRRAAAKRLAKRREATR